MLEQDGAGFADRVEDVGGADQLGVVDRVMRLVVQFGPIDGGDLEQIAQAHHPVGLEHVGFLVQTQFGGQHAAVQRMHVGLHLEAHDRCEAALAQLGLDQGQQVVGLLLGLFRDRVAGDPEQFAGFHHHARKQQIQVVGHDLFEWHEDLVGQGQEARHAGAQWHLDPGERGLVVVRVAHRDQQIERQIGDERERMGRVHGLGRDQGEDVAQVDLAQLPLLRLVQIVISLHPYAVIGQQSTHLLPDAPLVLLDVAHLGVAFGDLQLGAAPVDGQFLHAGAQLLLEAADALHEEFVEIGVDDGQELDPLQQRCALVLGLVQHPAVEVQPGQFPVEIPFRRVQVEFGRLGCCLIRLDQRLGGSRFAGPGTRSGGFCGFRGSSACLKID
jgi:hypothetical protein